MKLFRQRLASMRTVARSRRVSGMKTNVYPTFVPRLWILACLLLDQGLIPDLLTFTCSKVARSRFLFSISNTNSVQLFVFCSFPQQGCGGIYTYTLIMVLSVPGSGAIEHTSERNAYFERSSLPIYGRQQRMHGWFQLLSPIVLQKRPESLS